MTLSRRGLFAVSAVSLATLTGCMGNQATGEVGDEGDTLWHSDPSQRPKAPRLSGNKIGGGKLNTSDLDGKIVVVNFWASWCAPCRREAPELAKAHEQADSDKTSFVGVNIRDDEDKAASMEKRLGVPYPSVFDPSGRLALNFEDVPPNTLPATVIMDASGRVAAVFRQEIDAGTLGDAIEEVAKSS